MALVADEPVVRLDGQTLSGDWSRAAPTVLAGLELDWGRASHYDDADPAQLALSLIDPDGELAGTDLTGQTIEVVRGDGYVLFRGSVNDHEAEPVRVRDPENGRRIDGWIVSLTAVDPSASLAQAVLPGPGTNAVTAEELGMHYWETQAPRARLDAILAQGADELVSSIEWRDPYPTGAYWPLIRFRKMADQHSALQMIEDVYKTHPLGYAYYDPDAHGIAIGQPATASGLALVWNGQVLSFEVRPYGYTFPGDRMRVPDGLTARTTLDKGIDVVQVTVPQQSPSTGYEVVEATTEVAVAGSAAGRIGRKVYAVKNDAWYNPPAQGNAAWQQLLADDAAEAVAELNGSLELPDLLIYPGEAIFSELARGHLIRAVALGDPVYFVGSVFAPLQRSGAVQQMIGGTLTWSRDPAKTEGRWEVLARFAPALGRAAGVTIDQLVRHNDPTLDDYAPGITLADLGNVTQGVPA